MRKFARAHSATLLALAAMLAVAALEAAVVTAPLAVPGGGPLSARLPIGLPGPGQDADADSYADAVDTVSGDRLLRIRLTALELPGGHPFILVGTQDDHGRTGAGAELEWQHIVDVDPLGRRAGSTSWSTASVRTGTWVATVPMDGEERAITTASHLDNQSRPSRSRWPQELVLNVRDDKTTLGLDVELWDVDSRPNRRAGLWHLDVDLRQGTVLAAGSSQSINQSLRLTAGSAWLELQIVPDVELDNATRLAIAQRWAPTVLFDSRERFFPVRGDALERFHGLYRNAANLQTWDPAFSNGRDTYRLLLADFDGDRRIDHRDAAVMADFLMVSDLGAPTIYAHVASANDGALVVQYWFLYFYNFVTGEDDRDIAFLAHDGDREFIQLQFASLDAAKNGTPREVILGRHYDGTRISDPTNLLEDGNLTVYIAQGSHAIYPAAGDDRRSRPALAGFYDRFDGEGTQWLAGNYSIELLGPQTWHAGALWGPATRFGRDLGTSARPLLQHDFRYPFTDPLFWASALEPLTAEQAIDLYEDRS